MRAVVQWMGMGVVGVSGGADREVVQWMGMELVGVSGGVNEGCCAVDGDGSGGGEWGSR